MVDSFYDPIPMSRNCATRDGLSRGDFISPPNWRFNVSVIGSRQKNETIFFYLESSCSVISSRMKSYFFRNPEIYIGQVDASADFAQLFPVWITENRNKNQKKKIGNPIKIRKFWPCFINSEIRIFHLLDLLFRTYSISFFSPRERFPSLSHFRLIPSWQLTHTVPFDRHFFKNSLIFRSTNFGKI